MGDFEHVKEATSLRAYVEAKLERAGGGYVCPACKSGTGPNHSPAFSIQPNGEKWKCFSCGAGGDVFDLAGIIYGTDDARERLRIVAEFAGVPLGGEAQDGGHWAKDGSGRDHYVYGWGDTIGGDTPQKQAAPDYTEGRNRAAAYIMSRAIISTEHCSQQSPHSLLTGRLTPQRGRWTKPMPVCRALPSTLTTTK